MSDIDVKATLTDREYEVAKRLAEGWNNHEIAKDLEISVKTVDTHRLHVLKKLKVRGNVELCHVMIRGAHLKLDGIFPQKT